MKKFITSFTSSDRTSLQHENPCRGTFLGLLALALISLSAMGNASILDQSNLPNNVGLNDHYEWQQQVTDGIGGMLAGIELYSSWSQFDGDRITVSIGLGPAPFTSSFAFTTTATLVASGTFIDTSVANINLTQGERFVIDVSGGPGCCGLAASNIPYSGGDLFANLPVFGSLTDYPLYSMAFETFITPTASGGGNTIPEPSTYTMLLAGLGLIGFTTLRRKQICVA